MKRMSKTLFDQKLFLGFVNKVNVDVTSVHIPASKHLSKFFYMGDEHHGGLINTFVVIEGESKGFIGKIISSEIPERERLDISQKAIEEKDFHPLIRIEILTCFDYYDLSFTKTISNYPNIGAKVYIARKEIIKEFIKK
jgi:uncharacterized protein